MADVTRILSQIEQGDSRAAEALLPLVYDELRKLAAAKLAQEKPGQTLQATALVHEAYLRLVKQGAGSQESGVGEGNSISTPDPRSPTPIRWDSRGHFFGAAAEAMRRILVEQARKKQSLRQGGEWQQQALENVEIAVPEPEVDLIAIHEALGKLERIDPVAAQLVKLRYFAGLTIPQAAAALAISSTTADRYWAYARSWLHAELAQGPSSRAG